MELLQNKLRPTKLNDVLGQEHLIGKNKILTNLVKEKKLFNIILYGKSGIGKTTIALALMNELNERYRLLNATINSKKDFEVVIEDKADAEADESAAKANVEKYRQLLAENAESENAVAVVGLTGTENC